MLQGLGLGNTERLALALDDARFVELAEDPGDGLPRRTGPARDVLVGGQRLDNDLAALRLAQFRKAQDLLLDTLTARNVERSMIRLSQMRTIWASRSITRMAIRGYSISNGSNRERGSDAIRLFWAPATLAERGLPSIAANSPK